MSTRSDHEFPDFMPAAPIILSIGINPSLHALRVGYPFAFARNRFWPALNGSRLIDTPLTPGLPAMRVLTTHYRIGFTDVVKHATAGMRDLRAADFAAGAPHLLAKIERLRPRILWFHGKVAARGFLRLPWGREAAVEWGEAAREVVGARVFVAPNPSPANASYALADLIAAYDALAAVRARLGA